MNLRLITKPASLPVSLEEAKAHLRVQHDDEDSLITLYLNAATAHIDGRHSWLGRALIDQTWELRLDAWPGKEIELALPPLIEIVSVKYTDEDGAEQTVDPADYEVDYDSEPPRIIAVEDFDWPETKAVTGAIVIRFRVGYVTGTADEPDVPAPIKQAILLMVGDMHANRETVIIGASAQSIPMSTTVMNLLHPYRVLK